MRRALALLGLLADGAEHPGSELATTLGVTRAAVWNQVRRLRAEGIAIDATPAHGYRLGGGFEALDGALVGSLLAQDGCHAWNAIEVAGVTDSTNERLLRAHDEQGGTHDQHGRVLFAEYQTAGRGRRGDRWISPPGSGLCFSLAWRFDTPPPTFSALSLAVGLAVVTCLEGEGVRDARLKWPNDVVRGNAKIAGILIEMRAEAGGPCLAVIGIGINTALPAAARGLIDRPSEDVSTASGRAVSRNRLAAALLASLATMLQRFARSGFAPFHAAWLARDALADTAVTLELGNRTVSGTARGVDEHGALVIEHGGARERFISGHLQRQ
ncbi:MAG: biotin--[acetyl-CoA-carboxylase] ligase [Gammaproteobacteria bacterium]